MTQHEWNESVRMPERRRFVRFGIMAAMAAALPLGLLHPALAVLTKRTIVPPARTRGKTVLNVRNSGARGDGVHDDTDAFQSAIDALPSDGGTVQVPAGTYLIDPVRSVRLRDRMHLDLAPQARLVAKPNGERRAYVLYAFKVADVEISGGSIQGDRAAHLVTTGEWGHGIRLGGASRVTVRDVNVADCWGDGICIGGADKQQELPCDDIVIANVTCRRNRRQGLSIGRSRNVRVHDSEFSDTAGTNPQYGIDIEPDRPGGADNVVIENCVIRGNQGGGIQIFHRVTNVTIKDCLIEKNRGRGILAVGAQDGLIVGNVIRDNGLVGVALRDKTQGYQVNANRFANNEARTPGKSAMHKVANPSASAIRTAPDTRAISMTGNSYDRRPE